MNLIFVKCFDNDSTGSFGVNEIRVNYGETVCINMVGERLRDLLW